MAYARAEAMSANVPLYNYLGGSNAHLLPVSLYEYYQWWEHADNNVDFSGIHDCSPRCKNFY